MLYIKWTQFALESRFIAALKNLTPKLQQRVAIILKL